MSENTKIRLFNSNINQYYYMDVKPERRRRKIQALFNRSICKILKIFWPNSNKELWERTKQNLIETEIKIGELN